MSRLTLHRRVHLAADEKVTTSKFVRCAESSRWTPVETCRRCTECQTVNDAAVTCDPASAAATETNPERAPITEVMDAHVLCIDAQATVESAQRTMDEQNAAIAIVVDAAHHAIGVCSRRSLAERAPSRRIERCMTPFVIMMLDGSTVADAIDLVVERDLRHVPVLSDGRVVGIVTPRAVIRWLAQNLREARSSRGRQGADGTKDPVLSDG